MPEAYKKLAVYLAPREDDDFLALCFLLAVPQSEAVRRAVRQYLAAHRRRKSPPDEREQPMEGQRRDRKLSLYIRDEGLAEALGETSRRWGVDATHVAALAVAAALAEHAEAIRELRAVRDRHQPPA